MEIAAVPLRALDATMRSKFSRSILRASPTSSADVDSSSSDGAADLAKGESAGGLQQGRRSRRTERGWRTGGRSPEESFPASTSEFGHSLQRSMCRLRSVGINLALRRRGQPGGMGRYRTCVAVPGELVRATGASTSPPRRPGEVFRDPLVTSAHFSTPQLHTYQVVVPV